MAHRGETVRKRTITLNVDKRLVEQARRMKLNLSQVFEAELANAIRQCEAQGWLRRNRAALDAYNEHIEKHGVFGEHLHSY